jgi:hypothetical protein
MTEAFGGKAGRQDRQVGMDAGGGGQQIVGIVDDFTDGFRGERVAEGVGKVVGGAVEEGVRRGRAAAFETAAAVARFWMLGHDTVSERRGPVMWKKRRAQSAT